MLSMDYSNRRRIADRLLSRRGTIAREVTAVFLERHPDWVDRYGDVARLRGEEDAVFHVEFLAGAVVAGEETAFADYARWTAGMLGARGISAGFLAENLEQVREAARSGLDEEARALVDRIAAAGVGAAESAGAGKPGAASVFEGMPPGAHTPDPGVGMRFPTQRSLYLQAVRSGSRRAALNVVLETLRNGASVPEVYSDLLQPVQYEIGRLWERNEITVAEEHMATAVTQYVVGQLYSHLEIPETVRGNAVVTGVSGELHQLGANMVADVLEADGWNVRFLGTQLPHRGVLDAIGEHEPRMVGVSATVLFNLKAVGELIADIRDRFGDGVAIIVGGAAFGSSPNAWRDMGADGYGRDLRDAVAVANRLAPAKEG